MLANGDYFSVGGIDANNSEIGVAGSAAGESLGTAGDHEQTVNQQCHIAAKTQTILIWGWSR